MRRLGESDLEITAIGLGCWQFSERKNAPGKFWPDLDSETTREIIEVSLAGGINWFDTAEMYGKGASERGLTTALKKLGKEPGDVVIATKWWPLPRFAGSLVRTAPKRLECLQGYPIDLHQIHHWASLSGTKAQMKAMAELLDEGKVRFAGVSNYGTKKMKRAHALLKELGHPLVSNQVKYSLLDRRPERGIVPVAKELGITVIAYSPLEQGLLTGKFHDDPKLIKGRPGPRKWLGAFRKKGMEKSRPVIEALREIAASYEVSPGQVALNWLCNFHGDTVVAIPGATKVKHAEQNAGALAFTLTDAELKRLDEVSAHFK